MFRYFKLIFECFKYCRLVTADLNVHEQIALCIIIICVVLWYFMTLCVRPAIIIIMHDLCFILLPMQSTLLLCVHITKIIFLNCISVSEHHKYKLGIYM